MWILIFYDFFPMEKEVRCAFINLIHLSPIWLLAVPKDELYIMQYQWGTALETLIFHWEKHTTEIRIPKILSKLGVQIDVGKWTSFGQLYSVYYMGFLVLWIHTDFFACVLYPLPMTELKVCVKNTWPPIIVHI